MTRTSLYRSFFIGGFAAVAVFTTGCDHGKQLKQETLNHQMHEKWDLTRIAVMYQLAEQQYQVGDFDKCKETLKEALAMKAPFPKIQILAAKVEIEQGSLETAVAYLREAIQLGPTDPESHYLMGVIFQRWQKPDVACDYYQAAWDRKPDEALYMLAVVEMKITLGKLDDAEKVLKDHLVYFEQSGAVRVALARIATLKNDYIAASKYYRDAAILVPDDKNVARSYAESLFYAGRFADALPLFDEMRKQTDVSDKENVLMMLGECYMNVRRPHDARNCFQEVVRDHPANKQAFISLAKACIQTGEPGIAMAAARKALGLDPDNVQAMILTALLQQKQKKWNDALATLDKASRIAPTDSTVLCMQGICTGNLGNKNEALAYYEKAVQANPKDAWAAELLGENKPAPVAPAVPATLAPAAPEPAASTDTPTPIAPTAVTPAAATPDMPALEPAAEPSAITPIETAATAAITPPAP